MKQISKKTNNGSNEKLNKHNMRSIEADQDEFKQDGKLSNHKLPANKKKNGRLSQTMVKVNQAYGGMVGNKQHKSGFKKSEQERKSGTQIRKNISLQNQSIDDENISTIKSMKSIELKRLNQQNINNFTTETGFNNTIGTREKFSSIQPKQAKQIRVEGKRNISSPPNVIQQIDNEAKQKKKIAPSIQDKNFNKQKIKQIYDKIRSPDPKQSTMTAETQIQNPLKDSKTQQSRSNVRRNTRTQDQYLTLLMGKSKKLIQQPKNKQKMTAQQLLSGKFSIVWIFALKSIKPEIKDRIYGMYNPLCDQDKAVPLVSNPKQIRDFINIPNCYFKIITDLQCAEVALGFRIYRTVIQFYIYNEKGNEALMEALQYKNLTRKVKNIFSEWDKILIRAQQQIQQQIAIFKVNQGLQKRQRQRKFPNFLKLTDTDKTDATLYRINLYGAIKLLSEEKKQNYESFLHLVLNKYGEKEDQKQNIQDYIKIDHIKSLTTTQQAKPIINFYVRESFYYQILNSMLRTMKTSQQFKPCILPFNQTYQSIKLYYQSFLKENNYQIPQMKVYRGCKISKKDLNQLKKGVFIQMFGFMSTSKSQQRAKDFVDRDGCLFVIHLKKRKINYQKFKNFDHGFVDINRYELASEQFKKEEQVLFNALNVYQVKQIQITDQYTYIHLEYGVIFDLLQKPRQKFTQDEYATLVNYHYCTKILGKIQDQGDVFLFANELIEAKQYYDNKIKQGSNLAHNYYKLANVQKQCGQIDQAEKNANHALKLYGDQIDKNDRQKCLKVFGIHTKNAQINFQRQDYLTADQQIDKALDLLTDEDLYQKGVKLRQRGEIKFKKGEIKNSQKDFQQSEVIFQNIRSQGKIRKLTAYKTYFLSHLSLLCSQKSRDDLKEQLTSEISKIEDMQKKIQQNYEDIEDELLKINKSLKDVALYVQDRQKYEVYVKKAQGYLFSLQARKVNDPDLKAKLLAMQAMISDYQQLAQSEKLMHQAIRLIEQKNPFDLKVADYSKILAKMQKSQLEKYTNPTKKIMNQKPIPPIPYNQKQRGEIYKRCKDNFTKTLNVLLYHAKDKASPEILDIRNQLGELTFGQNDYQQCQKVIKQARFGNEKVIHSQMAKTLVLRAKICFARGELKNAFETLNQALKVLEQAMVKKHHKQNQQKKMQKYQTIFENCDTYILIKFIRVNIYNKQKHHDLALKNVNQINDVIVKKVGVNDSHPLLADLLQVKGAIQVFNGNVYGFDEYFERAIKLRQNQFGFYHPSNAKSYCTYAKFLVIVRDQERASKMIEKAVQIISAFDESNPHYWAVYYSQGFYQQQIEEYEVSEQFYEKSWKWANKYFNKSHIAIKQIMLRYASSLNKCKKISESIKVYEKLEEELDSDIRQSNVRYEINSEVDDEKVSLKKLMYTQLSELEYEETKENESYVSTTNNQLVNTSLYKSKLNLLRNTYNIERV